MRIILTVAATLCLWAPAHAYDRAKLIDSFFSIVMIRGYNDDGSLAYGSGVIVTPGKVLTNCHIFRKTSQPWISRGEDTYPITAIQADKWHDVCLVTAESLPFKAAKLGKSTTLQKGENIVAMGHSSGSPMPLTSIGTVKSAYDLDNGKIIRSTARFSLGASGSGLFNEQGELVGINTFKTVGHDAYYYAIPIEWISNVEKQPAEISMQVDGKAFWEEEETSKPYFLRIAIPELHQNWPKLAELAQSWTEAEPFNTEAWYELGWANERMGRHEEAETDYRKSLHIDPSNIDSLFQLGVIAFEKGDKKQVQDIRVALLNLNKDIAEEFNQTVGCKEQC